MRSGPQFCQIAGGSWSLQTDRHADFLWCLYLDSPASALSMPEQASAQQQDSLVVFGAQPTQNTVGGSPMGVTGIDGVGVQG